MAIYIPPRYKSTVHILRKSRDTRNTFSTIASGVTVELQPAGGGMRFFDMTALRQNAYRMQMLTVNTSIAQGDIVRRSGERDLAIERIDTHHNQQECILIEMPQPR